MTTEKYIEYIFNSNYEEIEMNLNKMRDFIENDDKIFTKNFRNMYLIYLNKDYKNVQNLEEKIMNIQFDENDVIWFKKMVKKVQELRILPSIFDKVDDDDYNFLLDMKNKTLRKRLVEKYEDVQIASELLESLPLSYFK